MKRFIYHFDSHTEAPDVEGEIFGKSKLDVAEKLQRKFGIAGEDWGIAELLEHIEYFDKY